MHLSRFVGWTIAHLTAAVNVAWKWNEIYEYNSATATERLRNKVYVSQVSVCVYLKDIDCIATDSLWGIKATEMPSIWKYTHGCLYICICMCVSLSVCLSVCMFQLAESTNRRLCYRENLGSRLHQSQWTFCSRSIFYITRILTGLKKLLQLNNNSLATDSQTDRQSKTICRSI